MLWTPRNDTGLHHQRGSNFAWVRLRLRFPQAGTGKEGLMKAQFEIGQKVKAVAFVDCFGNHQDEVTDLTVTDVRLIEPQSMKPYYRVQAHKPNGSCCYVEAAERFFEAIQ
jgi:hypothetical protein